MEARVLEELLIIREADEGVLGAAEARVGEGKTEAIQQRVEAEGREEEETGEEEEIGGQRASSDDAFRVDPLTCPLPLGGEEGSGLVLVG